MRRFLLLLAAIGVGSMPVGRADSPSQPASNPTTVQVEKLIAQLGDNSFPVRTNALKALETLGPSALPQIREAIKQAADPEVRRHLEELLPKLERTATLAPKLLTLSLKDKPVRQAVSELARLTGYKLELWPNGGPNDERERRLLNLDLKAAPFWQALEQICEQGGVTLQEGWYGNENPVLRLEFGESYPIASSIEGPFRVKVLGFSYYRNLSFGGPRNNPDGPVQRHESLSLNLGVSVEPRLPLLGLGQPTLTEVADDQNQSLIFPQGGNEAGQFHSSYYRSYMQQANAQLVPSRGGKRIKSLKGTIPVTVVSAQKPKIVVEKLLEVKNKTFREGTSTLTIEEVNKNGQQITIKMSVSETAANNRDHLWMNSLTQRLEVSDGRGNKYQSYGHSWSGGGNNSVQGTFTFGASGGAAPLAFLLGPGQLKLTYFEWTTLTHAVAFDFKDLPLP